MSLRRIVGVAVAAVVVSGAGLLLSSPTGAVTPPTPISLDVGGMSSTSCPTPPLGVYHSIALQPATVVQFKQGTLVAGATSESLTITPAPNSTDPTSKAVIATVPVSGSTPYTFSRAATYTLTWQFKAVGPLGGIAVLGTQTGKLEINSSAAGCTVAVQLPVPSVSASAVPSPITSAINGGLGAVASNVNGALGPINSALPSLPTLPGGGLPTGLPTGPVLPGTSPGATAPAGNDGPGTNYKPTGPTVADRTVPKGYGTGSGVGGVYVPPAGSSSGGTGSQQAAPAANGKPAANTASSAASAVKNGGSPRTVELASTRPRSALGALPTLAVILAILALSGATAFYARTFLLQPAEARVPAKD